MIIFLRGQTYANIFIVHIYRMKIACIFILSASLCIWSLRSIVGMYDCLLWYRLTANTANVFTILIWPIFWFIWNNPGCVIDENTPFLWKADFLKKYWFSIIICFDIYFSKWKTNKNALNICMIKINHISLHPHYRSNAQDDSLAQQVEHIPFKDGVLGSNPRRITENKRKIKQIPDNQTLSGISFFWQIAENSRFKHIIGG